MLADEFATMLALIILLLSYEYLILCFYFPFTRHRNGNFCLMVTIGW